MTLAASALTALADVERQLSEREAALASAAELLSVDSRVQAAYNQGQRDKQAQIIAMIDQQSELLNRSGLSLTVLNTLKRSINDTGN